jgi:hypothetical protein
MWTLQEGRTSIAPHKCLEASRGSSSLWRKPCVTPAQNHGDEHILEQMKRHERMSNAALTHRWIKCILNEQLEISVSLKLKLANDVAMFAMLSIFPVS